MGPGGATRIMGVSANEKLGKFIGRISSIRCGDATVMDKLNA
jgi:hypothetical protein